MHINKPFHVTMATISVSSFLFASPLLLKWSQSKSIKVNSLSFHKISSVRRAVSFISVVQTLFGGVHAFMTDLQAERWVLDKGTKYDSFHKNSQILIIRDALSIKNSCRSALRKTVTLLFIYLTYKWVRLFRLIIFITETWGGRVVFCAKLNSKFESGEKNMAL